jgi:hypothetical protein
MADDLPPDEFGQLVAVMLRLHADFRRRHGLAPMRSAWSYIQTLEEMKGRAVLNEPGVLSSPRPGIGRAVEAVRRVFWKILKPVFDRQTEVNREAILGLQAVMRAGEQSRQTCVELMTRVASLEAEVRRLRDRHQ